jgi:uncharacterized membrane protein (UPF0127 family)
MGTSSKSASTSEPACWLVKDGHVLASAEIASSRSDRARGLLGRDGVDGVMVFEKVRSVHTFGMRFTIDVAFCDRDGVVLRVVTLRKGRVTRFVRKAARTLEAEAGAFSAWGVAVGDRLELR